MIPCGMHSSLLALLVAFAIPVAAQQAKLYRVGLIANSIPAADLVKGVTEVPAPRMIAEGLGKLGWIEGKNIQLIWKSVEGKFDRWPEVIDELVQVPVDVIVVFDSRAAAAAVGKTRVIPIVHAGFGNLLERKLVASLARPGGNVTGMSLDGMAALNGKRLALLKAAAPKITRVVFLDQWTQLPNQPPRDFSEETLSAARSLGVTIFYVNFERLDQMGAAFAQAVSKGANGVLVGGSSFFYYRDVQLALHEQIRRYKLPAIHIVPEAPRTGGLMAYGPNILEFYRGTPRYIDKILRGAKPADIPIERPSNFELIINLKAAKEIGLTIPAAVLAEARQVIE